MQDSTAMNTEFRIKWPRGELGALPDDAVQDINIQYIKEEIEDVEEKLEELENKFEDYDRAWSNYSNLSLAPYWGSFFGVPNCLAKSKNHWGSVGNGSLPQYTFSNVFSTRTILLNRSRIMCHSAS